MLEHGIIVITSSENAAGILVISIRNKTVTISVIYKDEVKAIGHKSYLNVTIRLLKYPISYQHIITQMFLILDKNSFSSVIYHSICESRTSTVIQGQKNRTV